MINNNNTSSSSNNSSSNHQHLHSPTKLTEFARDFEDKPESLFDRVVTKIQNVYNQSYNTVNDISSGTSTNTSSSTGQVGKSKFYSPPSTELAAPATDLDINSSSSSSLASSRPQPPTTLSLRSSSETRTISSVEDTEANEQNDEQHPLPSDANQGRTVTNVLKHISNIVASKNNNDLRNYKDTELQRFWMPDSKAKECYDCAQKFSTFRRKHHCRLCGQIFCSKCCNQVVPGRIVRCEGDLKVCNYCSKIVLTFLKSSSSTIGQDLQALQQHLSNKLEVQDGATAAAAATTTHRQQQQRRALTRKTSLGYQEERFTSQPGYTSTLTMDDRKNILQQSNSLITLHEEMRRELPAAQNCGQLLIEFLITKNKSANEAQAVAILNAMLAAGFLEPIVQDPEQTEFEASLHYKFAKSTLSGSRSDDTLQQFTVSSVEPPQPPKSMDVSLSFQQNAAQDIELENAMGFTTTTSKLLESYCDHEDQLLAQLLRANSLDQEWGKVLQTLCSTAANHFKPEYCSNDLMDIRNYVNFKKVPGGKRKDSTIVHGVAFSKNVAHKDMATHVPFPRILLLQCPIVYERIEGKFVTIETVLLQEKEYLRNVCARIMSFSPNVVLVHKNVAGIAQDLLRSFGVTLVLDVKLSVMERLSRTLQCDIVSSIESNITMPKLGYCNEFYIRSFNNNGTSNGASGKTLMCFEKLTNPLGYTCLLRGASNAELIRVKRVASALLFARYNWRLEMSFLLDEFAQPLGPKPSIFDSKESSPKSEIETGEKDVDHRAKRPAVGERKSEDKIMTVISENVADFTDPLRSSSPASAEMLDEDPEGQLVEALAVETRYDNRFRNALSSTLLSVSPFLTFPLPYLETEPGRNCKLRKLFPTELYFSKQWSKRHESGISGSNGDKENSEQQQLQQIQPLLPAHDFLRLKITSPASNRDIQSKLAEFRSFGGRFPKGKAPMLRPKRRDRGNSDMIIQRPQKVSEEQLYKDALDPQNHQRLPVLFCSFHYNPKGVSSFCKLPMLLDMKFYGQHDIMLEEFLQRYCCRFNSMCPSCNLPMLGHVRRYVHSLGCVHVYLTEDQTRSDPKRIYFTSWCSICNATTPSVPLSDSSKCLSLAKYLEMRFHGHAYKRRPTIDTTPEMQNPASCEHSLHRDYIHHFSFRGVGAKFQYKPVEVWETGLPSLILQLDQPRPASQIASQVQEEIKLFSVRGHEVYTKIHERIADLAIEDENSLLMQNLKAQLAKDQFAFKQKIEIVHTLLTEPKANVYDINDALISSRRALADSIDLWGPRLQESQKLSMNKQQQSKHSHVDAGTICTEELRPDVQSCDLGDVVPPPVASVECPSEDTEVPVLEKNSTLTQSNSDKKSIKQILTQLLPSTNQVNPLQSPFSAQEHLTLPLGAIPIHVRENDLSSVIAYCLTSTDYQRAVEESFNAGSGSAEASSSPQLKRKMAMSTAESDLEDNATLCSPAAESSSEDKNKAGCKPLSPSPHISLTFNDQGSQFQCKIYFAREFDAMRAKKPKKPPKLDKSLYRKLEKSKMREELRISQSRTGSEMELVRKPSDLVGPSPMLQRGQDDQHIDFEEESRIALARSLCNSVHWEARGGKSGSRFCKTLDDRFVLKEMNTKEMTLFEQFAPKYFEYLAKSQHLQLPTLLAKIFGVFKVSIKKKDFFVEKSLLVMENLFYGCDISNKYDLKGSERNRLVDTTHQNGEIVLLDENLVQMSWSNPLYVLSHSKSVLKDAIQRDTSFLERNGVMDYSLLVGLDKENSVLVLGIIDYIRTFTLDKRVESMFKQSVIMGGGKGKDPTIISPERYKQRFIDAMDRYFYTVPDRWEGLSKV